jgi:hypothetical protein
MTLEFYSQIPKNPQISNFMSVRPVRAELFHAGGQTACHYEANSRFFAKASKTGFQKTMFARKYILLPVKFNVLLARPFVLGINDTVETFAE